MTTNVPLADGIERVILVTVDCLRWDYHDAYRELYPPGIWYRATSQGTHTSIAHASLFTGLNPPRHQYGAFGEELGIDDHLFTVTNSASCSDLTNPAHGLMPDVRADTQGRFHCTNWFPNALGRNGSLHETDLNDPPSEFLDHAVDADLTFLHDWVIHATTSTGHEDIDWNWPCDSHDPAQNHHRYQKHVEFSTTAHGNVLDALKDHGLYEDTLFVVWGDHGQGLGADPFQTTSHGGHPCEELARVPLGFCSPIFEQTVVDTRTNARAVDVLPTLQTILQHADLPVGAVSHELEGVDLTTFEGHLAGYTAAYSGADSIRTSDAALLDRDEETVLTEVYPTRQADHRLQRIVDDHPLAESLTDCYQDVCTTPTTLVL